MRTYYPIDKVRLSVYVEQLMYVLWTQIVPLEEDVQLEVISMDAIKTILMVMVFVLLACSPELGSDACCARV